MNKIKLIDLIDAITCRCAFCGQMFSVCRSCWRGQKTCSKECSRENYLRRRRLTQKKYSKTEKGLESGRVRQRRRYEKSKEEEPIWNLPH